MWVSELWEARSGVTAYRPKEKIWATGQRFH
jgi:hypothetical protein